MLVEYFTIEACLSFEHGCDMSDELSHEVARLNEKFYSQQGHRIRAIAEKADPFTKRRLLDLARKYDDRKPVAMVNLPLTGSAILRAMSGGER